jgi:hypothetical protein
MKFAVWIYAPPGDVHWQGLREAAAGVADSLKRLGHDVVFVPGMASEVIAAAHEVSSNRRIIAFNAHRLPEDVVLPEDSILYNAEQVQVDGLLGEAWRQSPYLTRLRQHAVWDYSESNIARLKSLGVDRALLCRIGYWPGLSSIAPAEREDLDVLFCGSIDVTNPNDRRRQAIEDVARRRIRVHVLSGVYGEERDRWIARAKIVLNVHFYPSPIWEIFRCSLLLANRKCVVSEGGGSDAALETFAAGATALVPYDQIGAACANLLRDDGLRRVTAARGFHAFEKISQADEVKAALEVAT